MALWMKINLKLMSVATSEYQDWMLDYMCCGVWFSRGSILGWRIEYRLGLHNYIRTLV
jgi:hypothetical protein